VKPIARFLVVAAIGAASLAMPTDGAAQGRAVARPPVRHPGYAYGGPYYRPYYSPYYRPYYSHPYYYGPAFGVGYGGWYGGLGLSFGFGWYGWPGAYGYPYAAYAPYPYPYAYQYDYSGSARLEVKPQEAEVFIDGYAVGTVDDFDGWMQRLRVDPGEHELAIYLKGHHTFRQNVLFRPGATLKVEHVMQPLAAGEPEEPRPVPNRAAGRGPVRRDAEDYPPPRASSPDDRHQPADRPPSQRRGAPEPPRSDQYGSVAVRVQPLDAEVLVDGETWQSPDAGNITLQVAEGTHRVEIHKDGYRTYTAEVRVRRGESTAVNVSLSRQ
jgi:hypothetical protein